MADEKISADSKILPILHRELKDDIKKKAKKKGWDENETDDFISGLLKLYKETVELALRENVAVNQGQTPTSTSKVKQEMEPLDKGRAKEVNEMCAKSEELLTCTIKKRKACPQKIKESLRTKHDAELMNLQKLKDKVREEENDAANSNPEAKFDMTECDNSWPRLKPACEDHTQFSKLLSEQKEKFQRFNTVAKMKLKMQDNELHRTLFSKRKLPSSFDSMLASPSKELKLDDTVIDSIHSNTFENNTLSVAWSNKQNGRLKSLEGCKRKKSPDKNLEV